MKKVLLSLILLLCSFVMQAQLNTDRILAIGQNALYFEDYVLSIQYFNQVIRIKPYLTDPYLYRAIAKIQLGDYQGADADCSIAIEKNPFTPQAYYARGFARNKMSQFALAAADFTKALEFSPDNSEYIMMRANAYERSEDYDKALKDLDLYWKLNPKSNDLHFERGRIQLAKKDTIAAEKSFDTFIKHDSINSLGWSARALLKMQRNDKTGALSDYTEAIKRKSTYVGDFINRGILNVELKHYNQALSDYNEAIKLDSKNDLIYYNRGLLRANLGDDNNALSDLSTVVKLDTANMEARLSKAMLEAKLKNYRNAIADYNIILKKYPYFLPAYLGIADAEDARGNIKIAYRYRKMAHDMEENKEYIKRKAKETLVAKNKMANSQQQSSGGHKTELFNRFAAQNQDSKETESKYSNETRGAVQDKYTDVVNERNFVLTYYAKPDELRNTNKYYPAVDQYNKQKKIDGNLKITNNEIPLTAELVNHHFDAINNISNRLSKNDNNPDIYFNRALEFAMVQDFKSSIEDLNKAISLRPDFMLAYFCRAVIRNKQVEYQKTVADQNITDVAERKRAKQLQDQQLMFDVEIIMRDYEKVSELNPDFTFAYFNKANILCTQKDFKGAISSYSKAIEFDGGFAEAYFNRGLTYLFIGEDAKGLADLSKSGELGLYKAYNLIQRFKK